MKILTESELRIVIGGNAASDPKVNPVAADNQTFYFSSVTAEDDWESPVA